MIGPDFTPLDKLTYHIDPDCNPDSLNVTEYSLKVDNAEYTLTNTSYTFHVTNGSYTYNISTTDKIYEPNPSSGSLKVNGTSVSEPITFLECY